MGFMGIDSIGSSDNAFDHAMGAVNAFGDELLKIVDNEDNGYNTPGYIDVALMIKDICGDISYYTLSDSCKTAAKECLKLLNKNKKSWLKHNDKYIVEDYKILIKHVEKFIKNCPS